MAASSGHSYFDSPSAWCSITQVLFCHTLQSRCFNHPFLPDVIYTIIGLVHEDNVLIFIKLLSFTAIFHNFAAAKAR